MNRRQLESLAAGGAFDALEPNRAKVLANADTLLAEADRSAREKVSDQYNLLGGDEHPAQGLRLVDADPWPRAEQMTNEKETFGFYFAAHPVAEFRAIASANGARSYASLMESRPGAGRHPAVMAALVEGVSRGRTKRGAEFIRGDFSDSTGQFSAACFEESLVPQFQRWAEQGTCVLLNVELDSPSADEPPRITVRGARALADVTNSARMLLRLDVRSADALPILQAALREGDPGRGEVLARLLLDNGESPVLRLGRDFALDGDLVESLSNVDGIENPVLAPQRGAGRLKLVA